MEGKKVYSLDEIKKIAPGYRGKPANFDPTKVGKKSAPPRKPKEPSTNEKSRPGPSSDQLPPPARPQRAPTAQRNESMISESIFGVDVSVTEIALNQEFGANYQRLIDISTETYQNFRADEKQLDRILANEEVAYYATALLWFRLLDVKAMEGNVALITEEKAIRKAIADEHFNVPQPLFASLFEIGNYTDKMEKETRHQVPALPATVVQGFGGPNAVAVDVQQELPSQQTLLETRHQYVNADLKSRKDSRDTALRQRLSRNSFQ
jgi:hypothetical protein